VILAGLTAGAWAIVGWYERTYGTPSCSWPMRVRGTATSTQTGLAGCYLQALANGDRAEMKAVASYIPPTRITPALFSYSRAARSGIASVTFAPNPIDSTYVFVTIRFADGKVESAGMLNMIAMGGSSNWRMDLP
jgi:hypothetical protein